MVCVAFTIIYEGYPWNMTREKGGKRKFPQISLCHYSLYQVVPEVANQHIYIRKSVKKRHQIRRGGFL